MPKERHSSRTLPAQHDASLASPTEPASMRLRALAMDLCKPGGEIPLVLFPEVHGARSTDTHLDPQGTGSCQPCPSLVKPSQVSPQAHCWEMVLVRGCPWRALDMGAPSAGATTAAPGWAGPAGTRGSPASRAWLRAQGTALFGGQSTRQAARSCRSRALSSCARPPQGDACSHFVHEAERGGKPGKRHVLVWRGDADSGRGRRTAPSSSAAGSAASADWPRWC